MDHPRLHTDWPKLTRAQKTALARFLDTAQQSPLIAHKLEQLGLRASQAHLLARILLIRLLSFLEGENERDIDKAFPTPALLFLKSEKSEEALRLECILRRVFPFYEDLMRDLQNFLLPQIIRSHGLRSVSPAVAGNNCDILPEVEKRIGLQIGAVNALDPIAWSLGDISANLTLSGGGELSPDDSRTIEEHESEMEMLERWRSENSSFGWMVMTGSESATTRLARNWIRRAAGQNRHGGFLDRADLGRLVRHPGFPAWRPLVDTVVVISGAATGLSDLQRFLSRCLSASEKQPRFNPPRLRLLLLERSADPETGWLSALLRESGDRSIRAALRALIELHPLPERDSGNFTDWSMMVRAAELGPEALSHLLGQTGACRKVHQSLRRAILNLRSAFDRQPEIHAQTMSGLIDFYLKYCLRLKRDTEVGLIGPILLRLKKLDRAAAGSAP